MNANFLNNDQENKVRREYLRALDLKSLSLCHLRLFQLPNYIFNAETMASVTKLDLSNNCLKSIPSELSVFSSLKELWLHKNPILQFPMSILSLKKLQVLDIRDTKIDYIPAEIATLPKLFELDWRNTPLSAALKASYNIRENNMVTLKDLFSQIHTRKQLQEQLQDSLAEFYAIEADKADFNEWIDGLVHKISDLFPILDEFKMFVRRATALLPEKRVEITDRSLEKTKQKFYAMQRDTERKRMSADVDIVLRNIYFDRVERIMVEHMIGSIYEHVLELEDIEFLVKYATQLFPPTPEEVNGELIWSNILKLQSELTQKRQAGVEALAGALSQLYPEQKPEQVGRPSFHYIYLLSFDFQYHSIPQFSLFVLYSTFYIMFLYILYSISFSIHYPLSPLSRSTTPLSLSQPYSKPTDSPPSASSIVSSKSPPR